MATKNGLIKKTPLTEYENIRKGGKIAIKLLEGDELIGVDITSGRDDVLIGTYLGKAIRFNETDVREVGRDSQGVRSIKLASGDYVVDMAIVHEGAEILTISENGYGKLSPVEEFRLQQRGGMGIKAGAFTEKTGNLIALKQIESPMDLLVITDGGIIIRTPVDGISKFSRVSQGVKIMRLKGGNKITSVALTEKEEEEEELSGEEAEYATAENAEETFDNEIETSEIAEDETLDGENAENDGNSEKED